MKIFDKRPLCLILCILLGGFVFFTETSSELKIILFSLALIGLIVSVFFIIKAYVHRVLCIVCSVVLLLSSLFSFLYFNCYFNVYEHYTEEVEIVGITRECKARASGTEVTVETISINGEGANYKITVFIPKSLCDSVEKNQKINVRGKLTDFTNTSEFDTRTYYRSRGYSAKLKDVSSCVCVYSVENDLAGYMSDYREEICEWIIENAGDVGGGLLCAMLLGERSYLSPQLMLDFERTGLTHILALSGMHLAMLSFILTKILSFIRIKKKPRKIIEIAFVIFYITLTGFPVSVVRAAVMLIISSLLFLISEKSDSITTLAISAVLIVLVQPYSIYDLSLWLSVFATLGVLIYFELKTKEKLTNGGSLLKRIFRGAIASLLISLFAISATMLISTLSFGTLSIIAPISTPIVSVLLELFTYLGLLFLATLNLFGLGYAIGAFGHFISNIIGALSSISGIYLTADYWLIQATIYVFTVLLLLFLLLDIKRKRRFLITLLSVFVFIMTSAFFTFTIRKSGNDIEYVCLDDGDIIMLKSNNKLTCIDFSDSTVSDAYECLSYIEDYGVLELDRYVFTSYSTGLSNAAFSLLSSIYIEELYVPSPENEEEQEIADIINEELKDMRCNVIYYKSEEFLLFDEHTLYPAYRTTLGDNKRCAALIFDGDEVISYVSSGMLKDETKNVAIPLINGCNTLILGRHGDSYKDYNLVLKLNGIDRMIVSSRSFKISDYVSDHYSNTEIITAPEKISLKR